MLTAKQGEHDEAEGLELGADDFLRKPFSFVVLVARLRALIRRATNAADGVLTIGDLRVDPDKRRCWRGPSEIVLTARELELLVALARRDGGTATKPELLAEVWGFDFDGDDNIVEVYVRYLRTKIDRPFARNSLQTVRTLGYRLVDDLRVVNVDGWFRRVRGSVRLRVTLLAAGLFAVTLAVASFGLLRALERTLVDDVRSADRAALAAAGRPSCSRWASPPTPSRSPPSPARRSSCRLVGAQRVVVLAPSADILDQCDRRRRATSWRAIRSSTPAPCRWPVPSCSASTATLTPSTSRRCPSVA